MMAKQFKETQWQNKKIQHSWKGEKERNDKAILMRQKIINEIHDKTRQNNTSKDKKSQDKTGQVIV